MLVTGWEARRRLLRAATTIYLVLPWLLFAWGWLRPPLAAACTLVLVAVLAAASHDSWQAFRTLRSRKPERPGLPAGLLLWGGCACAFILIWLLLSGVGGFGLQNFDYLMNNGLLKDLVIQDWPPVAKVAGSPMHVVYYVGYYLPAALVGKWCGWSAANYFLFTWTLMGIALAFAWFVRLSRIDVTTRKNRILLVTASFCLSGGLDFIGSFLLHRQPFDPTCHVEWWAGYFQYSSQTALVYWVPQHTLAAWLLMGMVGDALLTPAPPKYLGMALAAGVIWSPFGVIGIAVYLPLLAVVYLRSRCRPLLLQPASVLFNVLALGIGGIGLLYLGSNRFSFPMGPIWRIVHQPYTLVTHLLAFWCLEFALLAGLVLLLIGISLKRSRAASGNGAAPPRQRFQQLQDDFKISPSQLGQFLLALIVLTALPAYHMGVYNDFVMRVSIPSLFVFWSFVAKMAVDASLQVRTRSRPLYGLFVLVAAAGFLSSTAEILRSVTNYHLGPPALASVAPLENANPREIVIHRMGRDDSVYVHYLAK